MLTKYKKKYFKCKIQFNVVDFEGKVIESDDGLFPDLENKFIHSIHPFFESLLGLYQQENKDFFFSCIHLNINNIDLIVDINLKTFGKGSFPLIIIQDFTDHYNNYQSTAQIKNESVINSQILELKNSYLNEKEEFKNKFIANFSHEIREPLSGIITFTDILKKTGVNSEQKGYIELIENSSNHLKQLIEDILDISKIEAGKLTLDIKPFNLKNLLSDLKKVYEVRAQNKGLTFVVNFSSRLPEMLEGDELRIRQILSNLLDNAIKFTPKGSVTFTVSLNQIRAQKASVYFEVKDTGIGIDDDQLEPIFDSFYRYNYPNITNNGSGMGLAIVKNLLDLLKSHIQVDSVKDEGSTFYTSIKIKLHNKLKKKKKKEETVDVINFSNKKYNILLVEDSAISQLSVLKILASKGNFFLDIVNNPNDVLHKIQNQEFDLVLMDIKIDAYNGEEITKQIRQLPEREHRKIPILAFTASVFKEDIRRYKRAGMNGVIEKPFDEPTLMKKLYDYLED